MFADGFPGVSFGAGSLPGSSATTGPIRTGGSAVNFGSLDGVTTALAPGGEAVAGGSAPSWVVPAVVALVVVVLIARG